MRKILSFLAVLGTLSYQAMAAFNPVTHLSGTNTINGVAVTVAPIGAASNANMCVAGPYFIGYLPGGYQYNFSPTNRVTHIRLNVADMQRDDTLYVKINGVAFPLNNSMVTDLLACPDTTWGTVNTFGGKLITTAPAGTRTDAIVTFASSPSFISQLEILHDHGNTNSGGLIYSLEFDVDSCNQPFKAKADSPYCSGRSLQLRATDFPNATFTWAVYTGTPPTLTPGVWTSNVREPVVPSVTFTGNYDYYVATATRGACTYTDTAKILVDLTPTAVMEIAGPKCAGDEDTVKVRAALPAGGYVMIGKPNNTWVKPNTPPTFDFITLPNIQISDAGIYRGFAVNSTGCKSDTASINVTLNPLVKADFTFVEAPGCEQDSVKLTDMSLGNTTWRWEFGDGNTLMGSDPAIHQNPTHIYSAQGSYDIELFVTNGQCNDSITKKVIFYHPLSADFTMSADSICQNLQIDFTNLSEATPATIPTYLWDFKDGSTDYNFNTSHIFQNYGVYYVSLTITDYLGCSKTHTDTLVVDSLGSASFFSDTVICNGENIKFLGDYSLIGGTYAEWNFGDGHIIQDQFQIEHAFDKPGEYEVRLTANYRICPDTTYIQKIYVKPYPNIDLGPDTTICPQGAPVLLTDLVNSGNPAIKWRWNTETKDTSSSILARHPGMYAVTVEQDGCFATDTVEVKKNCYIDIPNVFTPNNDGYNDYFLPRQFLSRNVNKFNMVIYNRWGEMIFETNSLNGRGWDGKVNDKEQPNGVYVYMIKVSFANGTNENYQGNVTLLR